MRVLTICGSIAVTLALAPIAGAASMLKISGGGEGHGGSALQLVEAKANRERTVSLHELRQLTDVDPAGSVPPSQVARFQGRPDRQVDIGVPVVVDVDEEGAGGVFDDH